jgi:hypothetical protein
MEQLQLTENKKEILITLVLYLVRHDSGTPRIHPLGRIGKHHQMTGTAGVGIVEPDNWL